MNYYLLEYLFNTYAGGFFLPLSGGIDSTINALTIFMSCQNLAHHLYSINNIEIAYQIAYVLGETIKLAKFSGCSKGTDSFSGKELRLNLDRIALAKSLKGEISESCFYKYVDTKGEVLNDMTLAKRVLNVAYLPMSFSKATLPFYHQVVGALNCKSVTFPIQKIFDQFKRQGEEILRKWRIIHILG